MNEDKIILGTASGEGKNAGILHGAIRKLFEVGLGIMEDPGQSESGPQAAVAVAEYLETVAREELDEVTYVCKTKDGEIKRSQQFEQSDYTQWRKLAEMLRNPDPYRGDIFAAAKAWEVLHVRGARFELVSGRGNQVAKTLGLTFGMAADYFLGQTGVVLGIPHDFEPSHLPNRYCFIP